MTSWNTVRDLLPKIILLLLGFLFLWYLSTSAYNTLSGDDMVFVKLFERSTIPEVVTSWYTGWTARVSNAISLGIIYEFTPSRLLSHIGPLLSLGGLFTSLFVLFRTALKRYLEDTHLTIVASILSLVIVLSLSIYSLTTYDNFYWIAGIVTYVIPLILAGLLTALVLRSYSANKKVILYSAVSLLTLYVCLLNEAFTLQILFVSLIALAYVLVFLKNQRLRNTLIVVVAAILISILIIKLSPGTEARSLLNKSINPTMPTDIFSLIKMSINTTLRESLVFIRENIFGLLATFALSTSLAAAYRKQRLTLHTTKKLVLFCFAAFTPFVTMFILAFGVHYGHSPQITAYTLLTANFFFYICLAGAGLLLGLLLRGSSSFLRPMLIGTFGLAFVALLPFVFHISTINRLMVLQKEEYIQTMNEIQAAKSTGGKDVIIDTSVRYFTYCTPTTDTKTWCNIAYSDYYELNSIKAKEYREYNKTNLPPYGIGY